MKRTITALLAALMLLTLAACGSNSDPSGNGDAAVGGTTERGGGHRHCQRRCEPAG